MGSLKGEIDKMNKTMSTEVYERLNYIQKEVSDHKVCCLGDLEPSGGG